jgi:multimeric flavodoxin WrbA
MTGRIMKIIGINCSPRKNRTTQKSLETCLDAAREESDRIDTEIIALADLNIRGCLDCSYCKKQLKCKQEDDLNSLIPTLIDKYIAGIIIGTPVYLGTMTSQCKAFLDRSVLFRRNGFIFRNKVGGVLAIGGVRNGGQELTIQAVQAALMCHHMICVSDGLNTCHFGATLFSGGQGGLDADAFGLQTAHNHGRRVAQVALLLDNSKK